MNELIPINEHNGQKAVSARVLHEYLGSKREFSTWIKDRIKKYDLIENVDFVSFDEIVKRKEGVRGADVKTEYVLTLDCAKELSMVEGNAKGKQARKYFIACEKRLKEVAKTLTPAEQLLQNAQLLVEQERKIVEHDNRILKLEAKTATRPDYFTIVVMLLCTE